MKDKGALSPRDEKQSDILLALAQRCEIEEPSRYLDSAIAQCLEVLPTDPFKGDGPFERTKGMYWVIGTKDTPSGPAPERWSKTPPFYTTSLDAAVTIVPEGLQWSVQAWRDIVWANVVTGPGRGPLYRGEAKTPALALGAAALKARASMHSGEAHPSSSKAAP